MKKKLAAVVLASAFVLGGTVGTAQAGHGNKKVHKGSCKALVMVTCKNKLLNKVLNGNRVPILSGNDISL